MERTSRQEGWGEASRRGAAAALAVSLLGVGTAIFGAAVVPGTTTLSLGEVIRLGGVYLATFHRVPLTLGVPLGGEPVSIGLTFAPLLGTMLAAWLLYRAGRVAASASAPPHGASAVARVLRALRVVPGYAVPVAMIGAALAAAPLQLGPISVGPDMVPAVIFPFVWSVAAVSVGAIIGTRQGNSPGSHIGDAVAAGWRMLASGLVFAFVCSVLVAVVRPDDARIFFPGLRALDLEAGPLLAVHNLLFLPNEAEALLAASTGACVEIAGAGVQHTLACRGGLDLQIPTIGPVEAAAEPRAASGSVPLIYFLFLLAPTLATLWGGWVAGRRTGSDKRRAAVLAGLGAGVAFAVLSGCLALMASVSVDLGGVLSNQPTGADVTIGVHPVASAVFALGWGVVGGAIGAAAGFSRRVAAEDHPSS